MGYSQVPVKAQSSWRGPAMLEKSASPSWSTWLKRGDQLVTIDELGIGNYVKAEAVQLPGLRLQQITILSSGD